MIESREPEEPQVLQLSQLQQQQQEEERVICGAADANKGGLRCRFGNQEVDARQDEQGLIFCKPPPFQAEDSTNGSTKVAVEVYSNDMKIASDEYDYASPRLHQPLLRDSKACFTHGDVDPTIDAETGDDGAVRGGRMEDLKKRIELSGLLPFAIISSSYLLFTITDGAIRMIVLLHAYQSGFSAWEVAIMFSVYELAGVFTNLLAGVAGAKWGIKTTLLSGLSLQIVGISLLYAWQDSWVGDDKWKAILFVTFAQLPCGVAKDLTKLGGKTVTKLVTPDEKQSRLFKLVSLITGWKNSLKGVGYFLGAATVGVSYEMALGILLFLILLAMPWAIFGLSDKLGRTRKENLTMAKIFKQSYNVNVLSLSRFFLFGSRDMWFEVPLPFFLRDAMHGLGWSRQLTGLFLALFIIIYGQIQSWTPFLVLQPLRQVPANKYVAVLWNAILIIAPLWLAGVIQWSSWFQDSEVDKMAAVLIAGLGFFCFVFAVNSSVHSYLIVRYSDGDTAAINVGFYYMANAMGRLVGTLVSGALYSYSSDSLAGAFAACFWASFAFATMSTLVEVFVNDDHEGLMIGCLPLVRPKPPRGKNAEAGEVTIKMEA